MKWKLLEIDNKLDRGELFVLRSSSQEECIEKKIVKTLFEAPNFNFSLIYSTQTKMIGYHFDYKKLPANRILNSEKTVLWFYNKEMINPNIEVIYEDQVLRLLSYKEDKKEEEDFWLIGRWRYNA